jgi:hypothetical protein
MCQWLGSTRGRSGTGSVPATGSQWRIRHTRLNGTRCTYTSSVQNMPSPCSRLGSSQTAYGASSSPTPDDEHGRPRSTPKPLGVHSGRGCHSTPTGGLQFGSQFEAVLGRPQRSGQGRWSSMNRSGWPRSELLMRHTVQHGSTATSPHSSQQRRPAAHSASCDDSQTSSGAASSGSRG